MQNAFVLINCDVGFEKPIIRQLKQMKNVKDAYGTFGPYDVVATIEATNAEVIKKIIYQQIRKINHINATLTLMGTDPISTESDENGLIPDIIPDEKKPKEPPSEDEEYDEDDEDFKN